MNDLALMLRPQLAQPAAAPMRRRLAEAIKRAVLDGTLAAGSVLPASRALSQELGIARNTVLHVYEELATEGYVVADRQGTVVSHLPAAAAQDRAERRRGEQMPPMSRRGAPHGLRPDSHAENMAPFMPGVPALDEFPVERWQRHVAQAWKSLESGDLAGRSVAGEAVLRSAIAGYLRASRGVRCEAEQVVVTSGTQESLALCAHLLADPGDRVWMEDPGYPGAKAALLDAGLELVPVPVDAEGMSPPSALWKRRAPRLIYTTPSHQYPLGVVLSLSRRLALIEGARRAGAWILEDDYDSEFCRGVPLAAMQGLAPDAPVVYLGTFSKTLFPALRLGFMVLPPAAVDAMLPALDRRLAPGRPVEQEALASFIHEGEFTAHLRRMRRLYAEREEALREALARHWPLKLGLSPGRGGIHVAMALPRRRDDRGVVKRAWEQGLAPRALSNYAISAGSGLNGLVLGYANVAAGRADELVRRLVGVL